MIPSGRAFHKGDVFRIPILGDNSVTKTRTCVVLRPHPKPVPKCLAFVFCCSEKKANIEAVDTVPVDEPRWVTCLRLDHPSVFHIDDHRFIDITAPGLVSVGRCPSDLMVLLTRQFENAVRRGYPMPIIPPSAPADVVSAVTGLLADVDPLSTS